jgi:quinol monooxygenase YgiN
MTIAMAVFRCKSDQEQGELLAWLGGDDGLVKTRAYDGCQGIETLSGPDSVVALYERWESVEHHQAYVGWRMENGLVDLLEPWLAAPLEIAYYDETGV